MGFRLLNRELDSLAVSKEIKSRRKQCPLHETQNVLQRNKGIFNVVAPCKHSLEWLKGCERSDLYCCKLREEISGDSAL